MHRFKKKTQPKQETARRSAPPQAEVAPVRRACPYCGEDFSSRKTPSRRSHFKCPSCSETVYVEPAQPIYPTPYLDEVQVTYVNFLRQLDRLVYGIGGNDNYRRMRSHLAKRFGKDPSAGDVIWGLMNDSLLKACQDQFEWGDMKKLMKEFKELNMVRGHWRLRKQAPEKIV